MYSHHISHSSASFRVEAALAILYQLLTERSIYHQQAVLVVRLFSYSQGFDKKTVVAGRLKDIDATGFHGGTGSVAMQTQGIGKFRTIFTADAGAGE
jgi:hypothetical protein